MLCSTPFLNLSWPLALAPLSWEVRAGWNWNSADKSTARYRLITWPALLGARFIVLYKLRRREREQQQHSRASARVLSFFLCDMTIRFCSLYVYEVSVTSWQFAAAEHWIGTKNQIKLPRQAPAGPGGWSGNSSPRLSIAGWHHC